VLFQEVADIMMHRNARENMVRGNQAGPGRITFASEGSVWVGGVEVRMVHTGRGHTNGDSAVYFPSLKAVHTGDLVSEGQRSDGSTLTPVFDYNNGGSALEWPATLDGVLALDWDIAIPGHGFMMTRDEVQGFRDRVEQLTQRMAAYIKGGGSKDDIEAKFDTSDLGWPVVGNFVRALGNVYDEVAAAQR
jgi:glyoxylase-like metal-dependent hydrolase (beta-lactamase superfamily II)